jgi:hypothetical protein
MSGGYAVASTAKQRRVPRMTGSNQLNRARQYIQQKPMKLSIRERIRNWLLKDTDDMESVGIYAEDSDGVDLHSQGFRLQVYGASGGTIVETTKYDEKKDENRHSLYVVTEDKDLGEELAKIITMEQLR